MSSMNYKNDRCYNLDNLKKTEFGPNNEKEEEINRNQPNTNAVFYLNDTQVEHVQIQNMDQFLTVDCSNYFPRDVGFYLHPGEQSCSSASLFYPAEYQICPDDKTACRDKFLNTRDVPLQYEFNDQVKEGLQYLNILHSKNENDSPEFIDINKLVIPIEYDCLNLSAKTANGEEPLFLKRENGQVKDGTLKEETVVIDDDDDDVIFVKEYKASDDSPEVKSPLKDEKDSKEDVSSTTEINEDVCRRRRPKKLIEPRRNPKRQVQLQKASYDLAIKLSLSDYPKRSTSRDNYTTNTCRRSCRKTGAIFSPPRPLNSYDYKEWPTEGMHERPKYNCKTNKLEKFDYDYNPSPKPKKIMRTKRTMPVRRKGVGKKKDGLNKPETEVSPKFAQMTHETLLLVIDYVKAVKNSNELMMKHQCEDGDSENFKLSEDDVVKSIANAEDILTDISVLYCLANNVRQSDLAYFLESLPKNKPEEP